MRIKGIIIVNLILFVFLLGVLYLKFSREQVIIDAKIGSKPTMFLDVLERHELQSDKKFQALFIFAERPSLSSLEDIDKLYHLHKKEDVHFCAVFLNRFRLGEGYGFRIAFLSQYRFTYANSLEKIKNSPRFILLKEDRIIFADKMRELSQMDKVLLWLTKPDFDKPPPLSREDLRLVLLERLGHKQIELLDVRSRRIESLRTIILEGIEEIFLIDADCMSCELDKTIANIVDMKHRNVVLILSVRSNSYEIKALLNTRESNIRVFVDYFDGLELLHTEKSNKFNLMSFRRREICW